MKSFVTKRTVSAAPIGVSVPAGPFGAFHSPSITGDDGVALLQWNCTFSPEICGKRPVLIAGLQNAEKPFVNASSSLAPVSVRITVRLPNGRTENTSPQVTSPAASPALGGVTTRS